MKTLKQISFGIQFLLIVFMLDNQTLNARSTNLDTTFLHSLIGNHLITAQAENEKYVWVGTTEGLFLINKKQWHVQLLTPDNSLMPSFHVTALCVTSVGDVLIGTDNGLVRFDNYAFIILNTENSEMPSNNIVKIQDAKNGALVFNDASYKNKPMICTKEECGNENGWEIRPFFLALGN